MMGSLSCALQGALFGAIGAGVAGFIGHGMGLNIEGSIFTKGINVGKLFMKSAMHGLSRGIISDVIELILKVKYSCNGVYGVLKRLNITHKIASKVDPKKSELKIATWKEEVKKLL